LGFTAPKAFESAKKPTGKSWSGKFMEIARARQTLEVRSEGDRTLLFSLIIFHQKASLG